MQNWKRVLIITPAIASPQAYPFSPWQTMLMAHLRPVITVHQMRRECQSHHPPRLSQLLCSKPSSVRSLLKTVLAFTACSRQPALVFEFVMCTASYACVRQWRAKRALHKCSGTILELRSSINICIVVHMHARVHICQRSVVLTFVLLPARGVRG